MMMTNEQLEARLNATAQRLGRQPSAANGVMRRIAAGPGPAQAGGHRPPWRVIAAGFAAAAAVALAVTVALLMINTSSPAYGMEGAAERLREVKSLHIRGRHTFTPSEGQAVVIPLEYYLEPPHRYVQTHVGFSPGEVRSFTSMADGGKHLSLSHQDRTAFAGNQPLLETELRSASNYQMLAQQLGLLGPLALEYKKVGEERIDGVQCDVYEYARDAGPDGPHWVFRLWLDPRTGLPVRYRNIMQSGDESHVIELDTITVGGPAPESLREMKPPPDYAVHQADTDRVEFSIGSGHSSSTSLIMKYALDIDGRAVLMAWAQFDDSRQPPVEPGLAQPTPRWMEEPIPAEGGGEYRHLALRHDATPEGWHWRWSLLIPTDPKMSIASHPPVLNARGKGYQLNVTPLPLYFAKNRLADVVAALQKTTLPPGAGADDEAAIYTLADLRQLVAEAMGAPEQ